MNTINSVDFQGRKRTTLEINFNNMVSLDQIPIIDKIAKRYSESISFGMMCGQKTIWVKFKTFDTAIDFYKNWKRL